MRGTGAFRVRPVFRHRPRRHQPEGFLRPVHGRRLVDGRVHRKRRARQPVRPRLRARRRHHPGDHLDLLCRRRCLPRSLLRQRYRPHAQQGERESRSFSKAVSLQLYEKFKGRTKV